MAKKKWIDREMNATMLLHFFRHPVVFDETNGYLYFNNVFLTQTMGYDPEGVLRACFKMQVPNKYDGFRFARAEECDYATHTFGNDIPEIFFHRIYDNSDELDEICESE